MHDSHMKMLAKSRQKNCLHWVAKSMPDIYMLKPSKPGEKLYHFFT